MKDNNRTDNPLNETTPDELMEGFRGKNLKSIILFTVIAHAVIFLGTSVPFLVEKMGAGKAVELAEEERMKLAVQKATESLRAIADEHGLRVQELSSKFTDGQSNSASSKETRIEQEKTVLQEKEEPPKTLIEQELEVKSDGPEVPPIDEDDEDLFK